MRPETLNPKPKTRDRRPKSQILRPQDLRLESRDLKPDTQNPQPENQTRIPIFSTSLRCVCALPMRQVYRPSVHALNDEDWTHIPDAGTGTKWEMVQANAYCSSYVRKNIADDLSLSACAGAVAADPECDKVFYSNGKQCRCVKKGLVCDFKPSGSGNSVYKLQLSGGSAGGGGGGGGNYNGGGSRTTSLFAAPDRLCAALCSRQCGALCAWSRCERCVCYGLCFV